MANVTDCDYSKTNFWIQDRIIGKTFGCIIGLQFEKLRNCDRFWYETDDLKIGFTKKQLEAIKKVTLASIICKNLDQPCAFQKRAFELPNENYNPEIPCNLHASLDLSAWNSIKWHFHTNLTIITDWHELKTKMDRIQQTPWTWTK